MSHVASFAYMSKQTLGYLSLFAAAALYGSQNIATKIAGNSVSPFLSTSVRAFVVVLLVVWFVSWKRVAKKHIGWFIARSSANILSTTGLFFAITKIPVGTALFSFYAGMILATTLVGIMLYNERMSTVKYLSLLLTVIGLLCMYMTNSGFMFNMFIFIAAAGGVCAGLWSIFSRPLTGIYPLTQLVVLDNALACVFAFMFSLALREPMAGVTMSIPLVSLSYLGLTQAFTGQLVAYGFRYIDGQIGSIILLNDTIIGIVLSFFFFKESPSMNVIIGGLLIFSASVLPAIFSKPEKQ